MGGFPFSGGKRKPPSTPEFPCTEYTSNLVRILAEDLKKLSEAFVLDMGPVCGENITFIAKKVKKLFVCDMYFHFAYPHRKGSFSASYEHLDYPEQNFDLIFLWDLLERLEDPEAKRLSERCFHLAKPGAIIALCSLGKEADAATVNSFVMGTNYGITLRAQPHLVLSMRPRPNRDIIALMHPLEPVKSFVYRNGIREFIFRRN